MSSLHIVEASVHKQYGKGYRVKISIIDLGIYINGMMVYPPNEEHENWSVLTPARLAGRGKYARIVEFSKKLPLWNEVYEACIQAVKLYEVDSTVTGVDAVFDLPKDELEKEMDKAFGIELSNETP